MPASIKSIIEGNRARSVAKFDPDARVIYELITLITDIKYRNKYGKNVANPSVKRYNSNEQFEVLADQISPVDNGLLGYTRRELFGNGT